MVMEKADVLRKLQGLLAVAENSPFSEEAATAQAKADALMVAYSVEMWEIDQRRKPQERATPEIRRFDMTMTDSPVSDQMQTLFAVLCNHLRVRPVYYNYSLPKWMLNEPRQQYARVVGFAQELDYLEILFTSLRVQVASNLEPRPDSSLGFDENLVMLKEAGLKWQRIHEVLQPGVPWERRHGVRYTKIYTDYCRDTGRERMYTNPTVYQRNFIEGFATTIGTRLYDIRRVREQHEDRGTGMSLMLVDKGQQIKDLFGQEFQNLKSLESKKTKFDGAAYNRGGIAGSRADLGQDRVGSGPKELQ